MGSKKKIFIYRHGYESGSGGVILAKDLAEAQEQKKKIYFNASVTEAKPLQYIENGQIKTAPAIFEVYDY